MRRPEVPAPPRVCRGPLPPLIHLTKNDTDGEVIFVGTTDPNINRLSPTPPKKGLHGESYVLLTLKIPLLGSVEC
jgi:hypothetical protein